MDALRTENQLILTRLKELRLRKKDDSEINVLRERRMVIVNILWMDLHQKNHENQLIEAL